MHTFFTLDQGPGFVGGSGRVGEDIICVMTPKVLTDAATRRVAIELVRRQGGDCATCTVRGCPLRGA